MRACAHSGIRNAHPARPTALTRTRNETGRQHASPKPSRTCKESGPSTTATKRRTVLLGIAPLPGLLSGVFEETLPEVGNCASCVGEVDGTLGSCAGLPTCLSSYDDRPQHFVAPWEYQSSRAVAVQRLTDVVEGLGGDIVTVTAMYVRAVFDVLGGRGDFEFLFSPDGDNTVALRAVPRQRALPDLGQSMRQLEQLRIALGWDVVPVLRNRQRVLIFGESPFDTFGPAPPADLRDFANFE